MALGASHRLQDGVIAVETMTRFALAVLSLASGVYTYLGVRSILDGSPTAVFFAAIIYSASVSVAIYAFWSYMARFFPHVTGPAGRGAMLGVMALGCAMIIAMSSWLNAAALAGSAALEQHLAETVEDYTADLDQAHQNAPCRAEPAAGYPADLRTLRPAGRGRAAVRRTYRHHRLRQRRAAPVADVGAA